MSWFAYAGNPLHQEKDANSVISENIKTNSTVSWNNLEILEKIGEGASGNVFKARFLSRSVFIGIENKDVEFAAVKLFKGEMTSDGSPENEMEVGLLIYIFYCIFIVILKGN